MLSSLSYAIYKYTNNIYIWDLTPENLSSRFESNKGADQPAHLRSLISAFVIRSLESFISKFAKREISTFDPVSVAEQAGLGMILSETQKTGFLTLRPM